MRKRRKGAWVLVILAGLVGSAWKHAIASELEDPRSVSLPPGGSGQGGEPDDIWDHWDTAVRAWRVSGNDQLFLPERSLVAWIPSASAALREAEDSIAYRALGTVDGALSGALALIPIEGGNRALPRTEAVGVEPIIREALERGALLLTSRASDVAEDVVGKVAGRPEGSLHRAASRMLQRGHRIVVSGGAEPYAEVYRSPRASRASDSRDPEAGAPELVSSFYFGKLGGGLHALTSFEAYGRPQASSDASLRMLLFRGSWHRGAGWSYRAPRFNATAGTLSKLVRSIRLAGPHNRVAVFSM